MNASPSMYALRLFVIFASRLTQAVHQLDLFTAFLRKHQLNVDRSHVGLRVLPFMASWRPLKYGMIPAVFVPSQRKRLRPVI